MTPRSIHASYIQTVLHPILPPQPPNLIQMSLYRPLNRRVQLLRRGKVHPRGRSGDKVWVDDLDALEPRIASNRSDVESAEKGEEAGKASEETKLVICTAEGCALSEGPPTHVCVRSAQSLLLLQLRVLQVFALPDFRGTIQAPIRGSSSGKRQEELAQTVSFDERWLMRLDIPFIGSVVALVVQLFFSQPVPQNNGASQCDESRHGIRIEVITFTSPIHSISPTLHRLKTLDWERELKACKIVKWVTEPDLTQLRRDPRVNERTDKLMENPNF
ncbi:hypothetical protein JOM56_010022 [Amanita muscaria]